MRGIVCAASMNGFADIVAKIDDFVWGWPLMLLILGVGALYTVRTGALQVRRLGRALKYAVKEESGAPGEMSGFAALCTALSATIGTGNIVGVATAVASGGPGALLWMLVAAFFGMATKYAEGFLAVKYRSIDSNGHVLGGPFYYIENGMGKKWKWLAVLFAVFGACAGLFGIGTFTQISGIVAAAQSLFPGSQTLAVLGSAEHSVRITWPLVITGVLVTVCTAAVLFGGVRRLAKVSQVIVPLMTAAYLIFSLFTLIFNLPAIPGAVSLIVRSAFSAEAAAGAIAGLTVKTAMRRGIGRGVFSNEAGLGSAPIAAAAAKTNDPVRQGLVCMTGTFIDTIVLCTITGLAIVVTGAWDSRVTGGALQGFDITAYSWAEGIPFSPAVSTTVLSVCLIFFAFSSVLGWSYYSERCVEYLFKGSRRAVSVYRWLYIAAVAAGPYMTVSAVWGVADITNALMAVPNLIALTALNGVVVGATRDYFGRPRRAGPRRPRLVICRLNRPKSDPIIRKTHQSPSARMRAQKQ